MVSGLIPHVFRRSGKPRLKILVSYHYFKDTNLDVLFGQLSDGIELDVFGDSGAFSADSLGQPIDLKKYMEWVNRWKHWFVAYANLDVIGDERGTLVNQKRMEDSGFRPLPVFHQSEPFSSLEYYLEHYNYIGLGFLHLGISTHMIMRWLIRCFKMSQERAVFHGFGLTGWKYMSSLRFHSVDSTTWLNGARFGSVPLFDWRRSVLKSIPLGDALKIDELSGLIRSYGMETGWYLRENNRRVYNVLCGGLSFMKAQEYLRQKHGLIPVPNEPEQESGLHLYLSNTTPKEWFMLKDWYKSIEWD